MFYEPTLSLHENLTANGFSHQKWRDTYQHNIMCGRKIIFRGDASDVLEWIKKLVDSSTS